ncbi:MAG: PTS fructose transporter subunit IIC [Phycisphaerales bacterium]|nr:PTS fructose transporter subunit IIC [Phycisphaerales bacterium]MCB9856225.1 PTS fructose transporter subunit IIC [Phycisphaerales bacterium]MCB9863336.1 PTS fructose transporter subunit IIC [Phycisphaerales bacterium]
MREQLRKHKQYLLTGVSYVVPFIACGGVLVAIGLTGATMTAKGPNFDNAPIHGMIAQIGGAAFDLYLPILAGFIAFAIAGRPGLVPGMIGGFFCGFDFDGVPGPPEAKAGFLGAIIIGLIAGHFVNLFKYLPNSKFIRPILPILIIPVIGGVVVGLLMLNVIGNPVARMMTGLNTMLVDLQGGNALVLAAVLGGMIAFDMGGPVNKAAFFFSFSMLQQNPAIMGATAAAICTPPLGMGLATLVRRKIWTETERESGYAALGMGMMGITEGAIPFAVSDPFRVIPCIMLGSMAAAVTAMQFGVADHAPHGGPIVLPVVDNRIMYVVAILVGVAVTAASITAVKSIGKREGETT